VDALYKSTFTLLLLSNNLIDLAELIVILPIVVVVVVVKCYCS